MSQTENINLTIDDKEISVPKGTLVIEAVEMIGRELPRFCWHPGLSVAGVCRFCMVKIEGMPKLQIACNTQCTEGMKVITEAAEVKEAHKWALEFHLINHPLDCPICDQAGECELQNYYMKVGKYDSQMDEDKVLKPKALDVGRELVLDTERCILCSRCVRFEDEVTKTSALGIFNRGDHSIIGTFPNKKIDHNYSYNLADICPVGAFTSKDFRFKCRVWFLKETQTICPGCSTGCNVTLFQNRSTRDFHRLKPRRNKDVNGFWMCDEGRHMYQHANAAERTTQPLQRGNPIPWNEAPGVFQQQLQSVKQTLPESVHVILTPQYTNEEYDLAFQFLKSNFPNISSVFVWYNSTKTKDDFDGLLRRGDSNANTTGMTNKAHEYGIKLEYLDENLSQLSNLHSQTAFVFGPEIPSSYQNFDQDLAEIAKTKNTFYFGCGKSALFNGMLMVIPTLTFAEKNGSFTNTQGLTQKLKSANQVFPGMPDLSAFLAQ